MRTGSRPAGPSADEAPQPDDTIVLAPARPPRPPGRRLGPNGKRAAIAVGSVLVLVAVTVSVARTMGAEKAAPRPSPARSGPLVEPLLFHTAGSLVFMAEVNTERTNRDVGTTTFPYPPHRVWRLSLRSGLLEPGPVVPASLTTDLNATPDGVVTFMATTGSGTFLLSLDARGAMPREPTFLAQAEAYGPAGDGRVLFVERRPDQRSFRSALPTGDLEIGSVEVSGSGGRVLSSRQGPLPEIDHLATLDGTVYVSGLDTKGPFLARLLGDRLQVVLRGWVTESVLPGGRGFLGHRVPGPPAARFLRPGRPSVPWTTLDVDISRVLAWTPDGRAAAVIGRTSGPSALMICEQDSRPGFVFFAREPDSGGPFPGLADGAFSGDDRYLFYVGGGRIQAYDRRTEELTTVLSGSPVHPVGPIAWVP